MLALIKKFFFLFVIGFVSLLLFWKFTKSIKSELNNQTTSQTKKNNNNKSQTPNNSKIPPKKQIWFSNYRWLTDTEIDWAVEQIPQNNRFKTLPSYQFHYTKEANPNEADADLAFPELLSAINDDSKELIFIPVNQPDFHWSLLVYETKTKTFDHMIP